MKIAPRGGGGGLTSRLLFMFWAVYHPRSGPVRTTFGVHIRCPRCLHVQHEQFYIIGACLGKGLLGLHVGNELFLQGLELSFVLACRLPILADLFVGITMPLCFTARMIYVAIWSFR
jgi:hypothetical protein